MNYKRILGGVIVYVVVAVTVIGLVAFGHSLRGG